MSWSSFNRIRLVIIHMSMILKAYSSLLTDVSKLTGIHLDLPDDFDMSWVQISGPKLDKDMLQFLEFRTGILPAFPDWLMPLWNGFIDALPSGKAGRILGCLRTILGFGYKAEQVPTSEQLQKAQKAFEEANQDVGFWNSVFESTDSPDPLFREARRLVSRVISRVDWFEIIPSYGPGAVFPRRIPCEKGKFDVYKPIEAFYPYDKYFNCVHNVGMDDLMSHSYTTHDEITCRMVAVPKDSRGPRLICVHPSEAIWIQQGQRRVLERAIETSPLTSGKINFRDQSVNGSLALSSSRDRKYCTLDLKEASDRIGFSLVKYLFGKYAFDTIASTRASTVVLLDNRQVELQMFAPMGNCLTFPVESLVFWSLVRAGILSKYGVNCTEIYVFGDDIIFPTEYYDGAINGLIRAGLIPNVSKTFKDGLFRESCGVDAYNGEDVTPHRIRVGGVNSYSDAESVCDLAKRLRIDQYSDTSAFLYSTVSRRFGRLSLTNNPNCQGLVEYVSYDLGDILRYEDRTLYDSWHQVYCVPYRSRVRTLEVITTHAWWHVQDSLLSLLRREKGIPEGSLFSDSPLVYSERGLRYPTPRGEKLKTMYCEVHHSKPSIPEGFLLKLKRLDNEDRLCIDLFEAYRVDKNRVHPVIAP
jgi:hypothetical protein